MKRNLKKIFTLILLCLTCLSAIAVVNAESAPGSLSISSYKVSNTPISFPATFRAKKTNDGRYSYCAHYSKTPPNTGVGYTRGSLITDNGINYILNKAYGVKDDASFFVYQTALWVYMIDRGIMPGSYYTLTVFRSQINNSGAATANQIKAIVAEAKNCVGFNKDNPTISINTSNAKFALDSTGTYYVSEGISVVTSTGAYNVSITGAPEGTTYTKSGSNLVIKVPASKVTALKTNITFSVNNSKDVYNSYYYNPSNSGYQVMTATYKETKTASANGSLSIKKKASLSIVKIDSSSKEAIEGAKLQVLNGNGKVVDEWTSTKDAHPVTGLTVGTYTLKEIQAPDGYKLSDVETKFTVGADGKIKDSAGNVITKLSYSNEKTGITISKQDITNQEELPGATLVIKDKDGNQVAKWVSSDKKYVIKGLAAGTYTLTEIIAPEGYILSTETITFKIDEKGNLYNEDGKAVSHIVMYNQPEEVKGGVSVSKQDITNGKEIGGAHLVVKDYDGNIIDEWISEEGKSHLIEDLKPGIYTLTETIAPEGYILSTETITFTVKEDGSITKVIMYNSPNTKDVPVENTASFKSVVSSLVGVMIVLLGTTILVKTSKKNTLN